MLFVKYTDSLLGPASSNTAACFIKKKFLGANMRPPLFLSILNLANIRDHILLALLPPVLSPLTPNNHQTCKKCNTVIS